jgi:two-component system phosphate regulon sensor histidine kinase PhoR
VYNLLDNALKYGAAKPVIQLEVDMSGHDANIIVKDNGIGIPVAYQDKIFDKFFGYRRSDRHNVRAMVWD